MTAEEGQRTMLREQKTPMQMAPNSVRLIHIQRPREVQGLPCDQCNTATDQPTFWRIRAHIWDKAQDKAKSSTTVVGHACCEVCARQIYDSIRVEISLITGERPIVKKAAVP